MWIALIMAVTHTTDRTTTLERIQNMKVTITTLKAMAKKNGWKFTYKSGKLHRLETVKRIEFHITWKDGIEETFTEDDMEYAFETMVDYQRKGW